MPSQIKVIYNLPTNDDIEGIIYKAIIKKFRMINHSIIHYYNQP